MSSFLLGRFLHPGVFSLCVLLPLFASATTSHISFSYAARQRMQNRARLLKQYQTHLKKTGQLYCGRQCRKQKGATPAQPGADKTASRMVSCAAQGERPTLAGAGGEQSLLSSDHLHNITEVAIHRLEQQLGKPYVWGGTRPDQGFDCSGLVLCLQQDP